MKAILDRFINRITMYRLVLWTLLTLAIITIILAVFGVIQHDPFAMLFGGLTLIVASVLGNAAFAYMFGVRRNSDSALITAGILFFIFSPPVSIVDGVILGLVAVIAAASKYLLAWRGRHLFNPTAIAAVISGLVGLKYASWWIGTGPMMIIVAIAGLLILYKTRRIRMGLIFIAVCIVTTVVVSVQKGFELDAVLTLMANSWPMVFLAGFMLSEPLTQPPRSRQRTMFAVLVGVLASAQIAWGSFLITPEMALIIGNLFAFFCGQRAGVRLKLVGRRQLSRNQVEYRFESNHPLRYEAGQYLELQLPHIHADARGVRRSFTIAAAPDGNQLRIAVRHYTPSSTFKKALQTLPIGTILPVTGVYGDFILPKDPHAKVLLIAGGIGITPFRAQLEWLLKTNQSRDGILLYSVSNQADVVFEDVLMAEEHGIKTQVVTTPLNADTLVKLVPDIAQRHVYVSGPPGMVDALTASAKQLGAKKIHHDHFNGY